jgi:RNA polymerase sigma-70 factor (ECF subfamily)
LPFFLLLIEDGSRREEYAAAYYKYRQHLFVVAKTLLKDDALAEDAIQNAFLSIIEKDSLPSVDENKLKAFLTIIVRNKAVDILRQRKHIMEELPADDRLGIACPVEGSDLALALSELPPEHRDILVNYYYVGISAKEMAAQEKVHYRTILNRIRKAEALLMESMKED